MSHRPLLFLDVDGPLNPFRAKARRRPDGYTTHRLRPHGWEDTPRPLRVWLRPDHGERLLALPYTLVWATTWEHDANTMIGPVLGLPELPVVELPHWSTAAEGLCFKTTTLVEYADGRPFAWVDDMITDRDVDLVRRRHPGAALLHRVDPRPGLLDADFRRLEEWPPARPAGALPEDA
ncbi:hypothetical protein PWG71_03910 [Nocardiopsis sp. N85]|uniref:HAD domain-containing protein n=1 Tax=Nocardiopsis sp. N85 TaxID=3029400 RepID=UPI00237F59F4|nr:HAD domain-containing protein [Nocardiopsis sp. N85]MDE3720521.1 hypothetical protein [Nocardiopsis sp. N85]